MRLMCSTMSLVVRCLICKLDEIKKLPAYTTILLQFSQGKAAKASAQGKKKKEKATYYQSNCRRAWQKVRTPRDYNCYSFFIIKE